jgi:hypothetical protein
MIHVQAGVDRADKEQVRDVMREHVACAVAPDLDDAVAIPIERRPDPARTLGRTGEHRHVADDGTGTEPRRCGQERRWRIGT